MSDLLSCAGVSVRYSLQGKRLRAGKPEGMLALREVSLTVGERSMVGIVGESGAGKSTLAKVLAGLIEPDGGTICFKGEPLRYPRERALTTAIQIVFQDPGSSLNPALTQRRVLSELLRYHKLADADRLEERCRELLDLVHLPERVLDARPRELSGGERQRMAIARALAVEPEVLLADEAVSSLDVSIQAEILRLFVELRDRLGLAVVLISHDLAVVAATCEEVMIMRAGEIIESGEVSQVFSSPVHGYTRALMDAVLRLGDSSGPEPSQVN